MINPEKEEIIVVDDNDNVIGHKPREAVDAEKLTYRVSALWMTNSKGEVLLARRAYTKVHNPGRWGPAAAGTVAEGESYYDNIKKEAKEELGLDGIQFKQGPKSKAEGKYDHFTQWFVCVTDKPAKDFKIQKEEVAEVRWFVISELREALKENPGGFIKGIGEILDLFAGH